MFALFMFGPMLEYAMGQRRFLTFYMLCGIGAGAFNSGVNTYMTYQLKSDTEIYLNNPSPDHLVQYYSKNFPDLYQNSDQLLKFIDNYSRDVKNNVLVEQSKFYVASSYSNNINSVTVGASGSVYGLLIAFALLFPNVELFLLFLPVPIKAKYMVLFYIAFELYAGLGYSGASNIAHFAHLGGALIGFLLIRFWNMQRQI